MKWFKHGSNMRNDTKLRRVINKYGLEGYGLYNLVVESIVESLDNDSPLPILEENIEDIAEFYHSNTSKIDEMLRYMVNQKLFDFTENDEIICVKVFKHLQSSQTRSEALRKLISNFDKNKPKLLPSKTVSDKQDIVLDKNKGDLSTITPVLDNCEEENTIEKEETTLQKNTNIDKSLFSPFPEFDKSEFQPEKKKSIIVPDNKKPETKLYNSIKDIFLSKNNGVFTSWPKEGKSIKELIKKAEIRYPENPDKFIQAVIEEFYNMTIGNDRFWKDQPFIPSALNSAGIFDRVIKKIQSEQPIEKTQEDIDFLKEVIF